MIDSKTLGRRIKYFRKRAGLSQMDLELAMNASAGMISRIESGKVNPSKETVRTIGRILEMNDKEVDYLIGPLSIPATQVEINLAINEIKDYMDQSATFAYLIDDRFRMLYVSKGFENVFKRLVPGYDSISKNVIGNTMVGLIFDETLGVKKFLKTEFYDEMVYLQLARLKKQMEYMVDDKYYKQAKEVVSKYPGVYKIWKGIADVDINFNSLDAKRVEFNIYGIKTKLYFSREAVWKYPRFETIEYVPNNKFLKLVQKVIRS